MLVDDSSGENSHTMIIGGVIAFCAVLIVMTMSILCCLSQSRKRRSSTQQNRKASIVGLTSEENGTTRDTIRSLQFNPNPAYTDTRQTDLVRYTTAQAKMNEAEEHDCYIYVDNQVQESDVEYANPAEIEKEILSASPRKQSVPSSVPAATWSHVPEQPHQQEQNISDEDEEGYVTYDPEKLPLDLLDSPEDSQIYQNTIRSSQSLMSERHGYVNDTQVAMEVSAVDQVQRNDDSQYDSETRDRNDSHSYVNDIESIVREAKRIKEKEELDNSVYVNNLDELVKAAKAKQARRSEVDGQAEDGREHDDRQKMYINDLFDVVQRALHEEHTAQYDKQQPSESLYVNDLPHLYANSYRK